MFLCDIWVKWLYVSSLVNNCIFTFKKKINNLAYIKMKNFTITFLLSLISLITFAQNDCQNAVNVSVGTYSVGIIDGVAPTLNCTTNVNGANAEWYKFTATEDVTIAINTDLPANSSIDTRLNVFTGDCGNLVCVGGNDDISGGNYASYFIFGVETGMDYYFVFDNKWTSDGFDFEITESALPPLEVDDVTFSGMSVSTLGNPNAFVDMNGDDLDDLVTVNSTTIRINYQKPDATFDVVDVTTTSADNNPSWSIAMGDLDGNGYMDLLYGGGSGATFMYGNATDTSNPANDYATNYTENSPSIYIFSQRTNFVDIDNDGLLDAFVCHDVAPNVYFINDGIGGLITHQVGDGNSVDLGMPGANYATIWFDYDNDHDIDVYISKCTSEPNRLYQNNGDGTYTDVSASLGAESFLRTWASAIGDFDNDGFMDILIGASSGANGLMKNNGDGTFTDVTLGSGFDAFNIASHEYIAQDFNNDGLLDIYSSGYIMLNNGNMNFSVSASGNQGQGGVGDADNDGFIDIFTGSTVKINNNTVGNWININLTGVQSNIDGIGARVEITSALGTQIRDVKSGVGFKYMSTLTAHFGLGTDTEIETVTVFWPSGIIDVIEDPSINTPINILEGSNPLGTDEVVLKDIKLYPNPARNELTISTTKDISNSIISIFSVRGKKVYNSYYKNNTIDVSTLNTGVYFLRIVKDGKQINIRFIKE